MSKDVKRVERHGGEAWEHTEMDALRKDKCLCLNCAHLEEGCDPASSLYAVCREDNIALAVTRCPYWKEMT